MLMLKRIELSGFKSFAKKTVLDFGVPVTAIVGPNGSGKSNVVEAIRFVLGEQSIKSLRGKGGADLIFKGSKNLTQLARARVTIVFDNTQKVFALERIGEKKLELDFDEVAISREVFADGTNTYKINDIDVRLKDIVEVVASVHIGSSGHHIISQGEADRLLTANAKDRRAMIEDALGLKIYQYRLKESERKLDKSLQNMKEVASLRREIAPHLQFLKKQVEKVEKAREFRIELTELYQDFFAHEKVYITTERKRLDNVARELNEAIQQADIKITEYETSSSDTTEQSSNSAKIETVSIELAKLTTTEAELTRKLGRVEGTIDLLEQQLAGPQDNTEEHIAVSLIDIEGLIADIDKDLRDISSESDLDRIREVLIHVRETCAQFVYFRKSTKNSSTINADALNQQINDLRINCRSLENEITLIEQDKQKIQNKIEQLSLLGKKETDTIRIRERTYYELKTEKTELMSRLRMSALERDTLEQIERYYEEEKEQARVLIGLDILRSISIPEVVRGRDEQNEYKRKIDRLKYKLEDSGAGSGSEVLKEFEETKVRDEFLARELDDLGLATNELRTLVRDLKEKIDIEFKTGIEKINEQFTQFFSLMFGGGHAFLSIIVEHKKHTKEEDDAEIIIQDEAGFEFERGIEIHVSLPHKKVKDLQMLSGGERSLTSIALLFAMSQVNPPPFLVLDETDAALDEANSRRYGDMIESLSKYSQLIVVTHNRETMSRANVLYGVTIGSDGASKLLSIKFDEAVQIAK